MNVQSRIDNQETLATLDTQDTGRTQTIEKTQHKKLTKISNPFKLNGRSFIILHLAAIWSM
jgi:hypothetical protein